MPVWSWSSDLRNSWIAWRSAGAGRGADDRPVVARPGDLEVAGPSASTPIRTTRAGLMSATFGLRKALGSGPRSFRTRRVDGDDVVLVAPPGVDLPLLPLDRLADVEDLRGLPPVDPAGVDLDGQARAS